MNKEITCLNCGKSQLSTVEWICGLVEIESISNDGVIEYKGNTEMLWDMSVCEVDNTGNPLLHCCECSHEWYEPHLNKGSAGVNTILTE